MGVAVNVTEVPVQTGFADATIETLTGKTGFTTIVTRLDVAGLPERHEPLAVSVHDNASLFSGLYEKVELVAPEMSAPFFFH